MPRLGCPGGRGPSRALGQEAGQGEVTAGPSGGQAVRGGAGGGKGGLGQSGRFHKPRGLCGRIPPTQTALWARLPAQRGRRHSWGDPQMRVSGRPRRGRKSGHQPGVTPVCPPGKERA